ncbi:MAG TPA: protein translocase subunit SecF [Pyrinomonadaceae bacterium]|nr:protein translocase subunit SecF [Pyrinomonadaceae bacterium]
MIQIFKNSNIDWLGKRRYFIGLSILLLLAGMGTAFYRHKFHPNGTEAFNLGVDFKGGTVVTARFKQPLSVEALRTAIDRAGVANSVIQQALDKPGEFLIKVPHQGSEETTSENQAGVDAARANVKKALDSFGPEAEPNKNLEDDPKAVYKIEGTEAVGQVASKQLRNQAIAVTIAALVGMLLFIAFRYEWTYGASAVIAVFHTVLVTLGLFSMFQWEINLTVIAALLTLVGFDVNDTIVIFDRIRENRKLYRRMSLYDVTNLSINQTLSRTVITSGLVFLSVVALVLLGGETLRPFSLALLMGIVFGTYDTIAVAGPIMVWWEKRLEAANKLPATAREAGIQTSGRGSARGASGRNEVAKASRAARV